MEVIEKEIEGVKVFVPRVFSDARGYFSETYSQKAIAPHAPGLQFVQDNESFSSEQYTLRGLHFQAPPFAQDKLIRVIKGRIFDVTVDVRKGSSTYGKWTGEELSAQNRKQLLAPAGFLHGFLTLEPETIVAYKVTNFYDAQSDGSVFWRSKTLDIDWPLNGGKVTLSEKDANAPLFEDFNSPF